MQIGVKILIGVSVVTASMLSLSSLGLLTKKTRSHKIYTQHIYYYYPKANFYYDSSDSKYIVWDTPTTNWRRTSELPVLQGDVGKNVRLGPSAEPVWKDNEYHRMIYSVSLYSSPNDWKKEGKNNATARTKTSAQTKPQKEEKRSGIRKFFDRLFSSKKKKDA